MTQLIVRDFTVSNETPDIGESITASLTIEHTDIDGEPVEYTATFFADGSQVEDATTLIYPAIQGVSEASPSATVSFDTEGPSYVSYTLTSDEQDAANFEGQQRVLVGISEEASEQELSETFFDDRQPVRFQQIDAPESPLVTDGGPATLSLKYDQPDISKSTSARFNEHKTIGGPTIRQKTGVDPVELSVSGVCTEREANAIDALRFEDTIFLDSSRAEVRCQVGSASTNPLDEGGAIDMDGEFTHDFSISLVEVQ